MKKIGILIIILVLLVSCNNEKEKKVEQVKINYENFVKMETSVKYQSLVKVKLNEIQGEKDFLNIFKEIKNKNKNYKNYFIRFYSNPMGIKGNDLDLFMVEQIGEDPIKIKPFWKNILFDKKIKIPDKYNKIGGFVKYSSVKIKNGETKENVILNLGKTLFKNGNQESYIIFNEKNDVLGNLIIRYKKNKVDKIGFISYSDFLSQKESNEIVSYFLGDKKIKLDQFYSVSGIDMTSIEFLDKLNKTKRMYGYPDFKVLEIPVINKNNYLVAIYEENDIFISAYLQNEKVNKIEVLYNKNKTEESYQKLLEELRIAFIISGNKVSYFNEVLNEIGFNYNMYMSNQDYTNSVLLGKYRFKIDKTKDKFSFQISNK